MNNCLVTKLKSSVNNESLSKLNVLTIKIKAIESPTENSQYIALKASENGPVSINSSSVGLYQSGISGALRPYPCIINANTHLNGWAENKVGIIEVTGKYNISQLILGQCGTVRIKEIYGIPSTFERLILANIEEEECDVSKLINSINRGKATEISIRSSSFVNKLSKNTVGEFISIENINSWFCLMFNDLGLDDLANNTAIKDITFTSLKGGNLSSLAKLTNLTTIQFIDGKQNSGDIMDFINPWIQAGRTSGKIEVYWLLGQKNVTLNGSPITYPEGVQNSRAYLNWTSDGTVTFTAS